MLTTKSNTKAHKENKMKISIFISIGYKEKEDDVLIGVDTNRRLIEIKQDGFLAHNEGWNGFIMTQEINVTRPKEGK